ncbi:MAG TPA: LuxR C-terminal-related transcriptional regulator [Rhizomicrobium sp.]|nr:LuxR C-terminal-related transcriptional regulator [Rhizomicrobium sp.]
MSFEPRHDAEGRRAGKVLIATDSGAHRASVSRFLANRGYSFVVADTVEETLAQLRTGGFELVVAAMTGEDADGMALMRRVREVMPGLPVIVLALGGAPIEPMHLDCATGLNHEIAKGPEGSTREVRGRLASLTARERQVLELIVAGRANKIIAYELNISPRTVENHRARVMEKLRATSVADVVRMALSAGLNA